MDFSNPRAFMKCYFVIVALMAFYPQSVQAQSPSPNPRTAASDTALDDARVAFEALSETDRKSIQGALIWTGDYNGVADGTFGRQTYAAIAAYQIRSRQQPNGILIPRARSGLLAAAQQARSAAGFTLVDDPKTGIRIGIPTKILSKQATSPSGGSRWQSADDRITLDTRLAPPDATLQSLYDRNLSIQTPGRAVNYKVLRPDFFVIAGETSIGKFYTRYSRGTGGLRGFSIGYDKTLAPQFDRFAVAVANSFTPFPEQLAPAAVAVAPVPKLEPQAPNLIGTGIVIGRRQVITTAPIASCRDVQVSGLKPRQINGRSPFVLEFADDLNAQPLKAAQGVLVEDSPLLVIGFAEEGGKMNLSAMPAKALKAGMISAPLQPGMSGALVIDMHGTLVGLAGILTSKPQRIAGIVPTANHPVVPVSELFGTAPVLADQWNETMAQSRTAADIVGSLRPSLVPIICGP
ncbi:serine protease [Microvirga soli]|uniref:serine protease n=1 Tax=Microvirga soli TaxID=1854496 RepID=UPI00191E6460|nr:serine protease [Microvirga soli]